MQPLLSLVATNFAPHSVKNLATKLPTFPKPSTAKVTSLSFILLCLAAIAAACATPKPVDPNSCGSPPKSFGFPVVLFGEPFPSTNHIISSSPVLTSGAAMYIFGEIFFSARPNATISCRFFSGWAFASKTIPLFPPPNGRPAMLVFHVIVRASRKTSSTSTVGVIRIPPFAGPRARLSRTTTAFSPLAASWTSIIFSGPHSSPNFTTCIIILYYLPSIINMPIRVAITGASGFIGRNTTAFLSREGIKVTAIVRPGKEEFVKKIGASKVKTIADISAETAAGEMAEIFFGHDAAVHFTYVSDFDVKIFEQKNTQANKNAVAAAARGGVKKFIANSGLGVADLGKKKET